MLFSCGLGGTLNINTVNGVFAMSGYREAGASVVSSRIGRYW